MKLFVFLTILGISVFHRQLFGIQHTRKSIACNASVILKDIWGGGEHKGAFVGKKFYPPIFIGYRLTFELADRKSISLIVPKKIYDGVSVGSIGFLEATGKHFENFTVIDRTSPAV